jgi:hypothetical protein
MAQSQNYTWVVPNAGVGILAFSLAGLVVPSILTFSIGRPAAGTGIAIFSMIVFVVICMATECRGWPRWRKIAFVPATWILQALLSIPALLTVGIVMRSLGLNYMIDSSMNFAAALPIVLFSMRRSTIFVSAQPT